MELDRFESLTDAELDQVAGGAGINILGSIVGSWWNFAGELVGATGDFWKGVFNGIGGLWDWG